VGLVPHLTGVPLLGYPLVAVEIAIMVFPPRVTRVVPAPLVAIVLLTAGTVVAAINVPTVGDQGDLPDSLPQLLFPDVPLTFQTVQIIAPFALTMALVGILESLLTAKLVDDVIGLFGSERGGSRREGARGVAG